MNRFMMIGCVLLLIGALGVQVNSGNRAMIGKGRHLHGILPQQLTGWTGREVPLGPTEATEEAVENILKFDDVYSREFFSAEKNLSLYVAYWDPGKMPVQVVASHTPDRCWTSAGWNCMEMRHRFILEELKPGEWREFSTPNISSRHVIFWHVIGDELYDYGDRFTRVPHPVKWWRDVIKQMFRDPREQYFIRLSSNRPFEELQGDPGFQQVLCALGKLGLTAGNQEGNPAD